jgi:hypothetical protein
MGRCLSCDQPMLPPGEVKRPNEYDHASGCPRDFKLTEARERELLYMTVGPQHTFGAARARVQNTLVRAGLARFASIPDGGDYCVITDAGRALLVSSAAPKEKP